MKEVNTILEMLIESRTQLLEAKVRLKEREAEIEKDLRDCYIAIAALTPKVEVAAEQPQEQTPEDLANVHSYLHVNGEPKKPYRIKTRQEMIDGGAVECEDGTIWPSTRAGETTVDWVKDMDYLQGMELETNTDQFIATKNHPVVTQWKIAPWMITENK